MEADTQTLVIPSAHKAVRGYTSSLDVSDQFLLYFNGNSVILLPHKAHYLSLTLNHISDITAAKFSSDGKLIASIDVKGTLIISEPCPDRIIQVYKYEGVFPNAKDIDWSSDRKKVCIVGEGKNKFAKVISIQTGVTAGEIGSVTATLNSCSFRPQRPFKLVMGGDQYTIKCYDGPPYNFIKSDKSHSGYINQVKYSPKGNYFLSGGADRKLVLYEGKTYEKVGEKQNAHNGSIFGLDWISQEYFVTVSSDKLIKIWDTKFQQKFVIETASPQDMKNPKKIGLFLVAIRVFKDNIYVANLDGDILVYSNPLTNNQSSLLQKYSGARSKIVKLLSFDLNNLILLDSGGRILSYNLSSKQISVCGIEIEMNSILNGFHLSQGNQHWLFVLTNNGLVWIYQGAESSKLTLSAKIENVEFKDISQGQDRHHLVGVTNNKLLIYDISSQKSSKEIVVEDDITCLNSSQHFILAGTIKGKVHIFSSQLELIQTVTLNTFKISTLSLIATSVPTSFRCIMGDACGNMSMIEISSQGIKSIKETMGGHTSVITGADSDQKFIYTFSMDGKVSVWDAESLQRLSEMKDTVTGGIVSGVSIGKYLGVSGGNLITKLLLKKQ